jgi:D-sedoheptulose 7-phosphate isomerase
LLEAPNEFSRLIESRIESSIRVKEQLMRQVPLCAAVAAELVRAYRSGKKVLLFGNGGSAADAQHIAAEFVGRFYCERAPLAAQALTVNTSVLTAIGNDYSFEHVFARQVEAFGQAGDVAIGLSTSGKSANVLRGLRAAKQHSMITVGMTGRDGGLMRLEVDYCLCVPSEDTPRVQEAHILIGHIWSELVERAVIDAGDLAAACAGA